MALLPALDGWSALSRGVSCAPPFQPKHFCSLHSTGLRRATADVRGCRQTVRLLPGSHQDWGRSQVSGLSYMTRLWQSSPNAAAWLCCVRFQGSTTTAGQAGMRRTGCAGKTQGQSCVQDLVACTGYVLCLGLHCIIHVRECPAWDREVAAPFLAASLGVCVNVLISEGLQLQPVLVFSMHLPVVFSVTVQSWLFICQDEK